MGFYFNIYPLRHEIEVKKNVLLLRILLCYRDKIFLRNYIDMNDSLKVISQDQIQFLTEAALSSPRKRKNLNLHVDLDDPIQRFFNVFTPGTYVRPHQHNDSNRWELFVLLQGEAVVVLFDDDGRLINRVILNDKRLAIEIPPKTWHSVTAGNKNAVLFECKSGPYLPMTDKDFADWAPKENHPRVADFLNWFKSGNINSYPPN